MIGYWIAQALSGVAPGRQSACLICRTVVRADDPAMSRPAKFVGPVNDEPAARQQQADRGWGTYARTAPPGVGSAWTTALVTIISVGGLGWTENGNDYSRYLPDTPDLCSSGVTLQALGLPVKRWGAVRATQRAR
jgi:hypothetical protein